MFERTKLVGSGFDRSARSEWRASRASRPSERVEGGGARAIAPGAGGRPLSARERGFFEPRFGHRFDQVKVHEDGDAARLSASMHARAFTHGQHIYFGAGQYRPGDDRGRRLFAHELAHTLQQRGGASGASGLVQRQPLSTPGADPCTYRGRANKDREVHLNLGLSAVRVFTRGGGHTQFDNLITGPATRGLARANGWCHMYSVKGHQRRSGLGLINFVNYCNEFGFHSNFWHHNGSIERIPGSVSHGCARLHDASATATGSGDSNRFFNLVHDGDCVRIYDRSSWRVPTFKPCPSNNETCRAAGD